MPYAQTTLLQAVNAVSARLEDPAQVRWTPPELVVYVTEALRTWSAFTQAFRNQVVFPTVTGQAFYDLSVVAPSLRGYTVHDADLVTAMEYHLLEPPTPAAWTGSEQFALADLTNALQRRRDQFLLETGAVLTRVLQGIAPPPDGRLSMADSTMTVRRAAWHTVPDGLIIPLRRDDEWAFNHYARNWVQNPSRPNLTWPTSYSVGVTPPLTLQIAPSPSDVGQLDLILVQRGAALNPAGPVLLGIPDDWTWVVKWGALADLLGQEGLAKDVPRATYCQARWEHGLQLATKASVVLAGRINNVVAQIDSLSDLDTYWRAWQTGTGAPSRMATAGQNLVALAVPPDTGGVSGQYGITLDVVSNCPIPLDLNHYLQVGSEVLDVILDYTQHLATVKEGGGQLEASQPLADRFFRAAGVTVRIDQQSTPNRRPLLGQTHQDERAHPRIDAEPVSA